MSSAAMSKKTKGKKVADPNETSKLLAAKISQLEQDAAGEKDQEAEIGAYSHLPERQLLRCCLLDMAHNGYVGKGLLTAAPRALQNAR